MNSCLFDQVNLFNYCFKESKLLGTTFILSSFKSYTFNNIIIRKFMNCKFKDCELTPRTKLFQTLLMDC